MFRNSLILFFALSLAGCGGFEGLKTPPQVDPAFMRQGEGILVPSTDKLDPSCKSGEVYDACIFQKNPVAQNKAFVSLNQLEDLRDYGVKIRGLGRGAYLENSRLRVLTLFTKRLSLAEKGSLLMPWSVEESFTEQLSAYYWSNLTLEYLIKQVGAERVPVSDLKIYVDDAFTGVVAANNSIHLEKKTLIVPKALSGEVVIHLLGQSLAGKLNGDKLFSKGSAQHNYCALDPKGCCSTVNGCSTALANGFGEYLVSMIFPANPIVGESIAGSVAGQSLCALRRDLAVLKTKTKDAVYTACANEKGRAPLMGAWYASVWWNLRVQVESQEAGAGMHIDRLFFDHAKVWTASSTFVEAKAEALRLAGIYESGKYKAAMTSAFQSAGL